MVVYERALIYKKVIKMVGFLSLDDMNMWIKAILSQDGFNNLLKILVAYVNTNWCKKYVYSERAFLLESGVAWWQSSAGITKLFSYYRVQVPGNYAKKIGVINEFYCFLIKSYHFCIFCYCTVT